MVQVIEVQITCPDQAVAEAIGNQLVALRLAACANIHAPVKSTYHWQGKVETAHEVPLVLKTREDLFDELCNAVRGMHPYDTPAILGLPVAYCNEDFAAWVAAETRQA
jgi:periplasmic divalent cation tolerance protein